MSEEEREIFKVYIDTEDLLKFIRREHGIPQYVDTESLRAELEEDGKRIVVYLKEEQLK